MGTGNELGAVVRFVAAAAVFAPLAVAVAVAVVVAAAAAATAVLLAFAVVTEAVGVVVPLPAVTDLARVEGDSFFAAAVSFL